MSDADENEADPAVPDGAAVFPTIPAELGVNPLLLAVLHATIFLAGSDDAGNPPNLEGTLLRAADRALAFTPHRHQGAAED